MRTYIARSYANLNKQLTVFCSKIDEYTALLNLDAAEVDMIKKDQKLLSFTVQADDLFHTYAQALAAFKKLLRYGVKDEVLNDFPPPPVLPGPVPDITGANLQERFSHLIQVCVHHKNFTENIGEDLGIIKPKTPFDPQAGKPSLKIKLTDGGHPRLSWAKKQYHGINIYKDAGDGNGFQFHNKSFRKQYVDKSHLPATGKSAVWKYKIIYLFGLNDEEAGSFSNEATVVVYGEV